MGQANDGERGKGGDIKEEGEIKGWREKRRDRERGGRETGERETERVQGESDGERETWGEEGERGRETGREVEA